MKKRAVEEVVEKEAADEISTENEDAEEKRSAPKYEENKLRGRIELVWPSKDFVFWDIYAGQPVWRLEKDIPLRIIRQREIVGESNCIYNSTEKKWVKCNIPLESENLMIRGDNLLALKALEEDFTGKVKLVYIDPPFNTGYAFEHYDDGLEHSTWLSMMKPRLKILRGLLCKEGLIFVHIDYRNFCQLKLLLDEEFTKNNLLSIITLKVKDAAGVGQESPIFDVCEYLLVYANNFEAAKEELRKKAYEYSAEQSFVKGYNKAIVGFGKPKLVKEIEQGRVGKIKIYELENYEVKKFGRKDSYKDYLSRFDKIFTDYNPSGGMILAIRDQIPEKGLSYIEYIPTKGASAGQLTKVYFLNNRIISFLNGIAEKSGDEIIRRKKLTNLWEVVTASLSNEGDVNFPQSKKPERLIQQIIELGSNPEDLVLDSFAGSGTTGAVAHKMGRKWIMVEIGKHAETLCKHRLSRVVSGEDQTGISKQVNWKGGGGFAYCELGDPLVITDKELGIQRINPKYNNGDLIRAVCKLEGFKLISKGRRVLHGKRGMTFAHVTEFYVTQEYLNHLTKEVDDDQKLVIYCYAHTSKLKLPKNVEVRRMPDQLSKNDGDSNE